MDAQRQRLGTFRSPRRSPAAPVDRHSAPRGRAPDAADRRRPCPRGAAPKSVSASVPHQAAPRTGLGDVLALGLGLVVMMAAVLLLLLAQAAVAASRAASAADLAALAAADAARESHPVSRARWPGRSRG